MTMTYESTARKLEAPEIDYFNYSDVHHHDPKKVIAFTDPHTAMRPHPSAASRHRRAAQRQERQMKLLVTYPRYLCVILFALFIYLRLATFDAPVAAFNLLWISGYILAGSSFIFAKLLKPSTAH